LLKTILQKVKIRLRLGLGHTNCLTKNAHYGLEIHKLLDITVH
jgi:hypothetical protein